MTPYGTFSSPLLLRPTYAIALLNLGNVYRRQRNFEKAEQCLSQALALQPDNLKSITASGMLLGPTRARCRRLWSISRKPLTCGQAILKP